MFSKEWRTLIVVAILAVLFLAIFIGSKYVGGEAPDLQFAAILPMTGASAGLGEASREGLYLAKEDFEKSGIRSNIKIFDSEGLKSKGQQIAETIATEGNIPFVFSSLSNITSAVNPISIKNKIILFYNSCNCGFAEENSYSFQLYFDPRLECELIGESYKKAGVKRAGFLGLDVPYGRYCYEKLQNIFGRENVFIETEAEDLRKDYGALLENFKKSEVGFVVSIPAVADFPTLFRLNYSSGINLPIVCFDGACLNQKIRETSEESWLSNVFPFGLSVEDNFKKRILSRNPDFNREEIVEAAIAYDSIHYAARVLQKCKDLDPECLVLNISKDKKYKGAIISEGFGKDRILDYRSIFEI